MAVYRQKLSVEIFEINLQKSTDQKIWFQESILNTDSSGAEQFA